MQIEPCGCKDRLGGHLRRATLFREFYRTHPQSAVLYLDAGQAFKFDSPEIPFALPAMKQVFTDLRLDALNLGAFELARGVGVALDSLEGAGFPLISANLRNIDDGTPVLPTHLALTPRLGAGGRAEGPRVGVIGVTAMDRYQVLDGRNGQKAHLIDPLRAVAEVLPEVRKSSDIVIVIGTVGRGIARQLSEHHPEIDLIVATDPQIGEEMREPATNAPIYFTGLLGKRQLRFDFQRPPRKGGATGSAGTRPWIVIGNITAINDSLNPDPEAREVLRRYAAGQEAHGFGTGVSVRGKTAG